LRFFDEDGDKTLFVMGDSPSVLFGEFLDLLLSPNTIAGPDPRQFWIVDGALICRLQFVRDVTREVLHKGLSL